MAKLFHYPGIFFLTVAFVLSLLASISLPYLTALDIARAKFETVNALDNSSVPITELRLGIWSACTYNLQDARTCSASELAYEVTIQNNESDREVVTISPSWTRGLVVLPLAAAVTLIALCLSLSTHLFVTLLASLVSFFSALLLLIAFAIQIALFARLKKLVGDLDIEGASTRPGIAFWLTFASLILTLLAGCTVCFGHRREKNARSARTSAAVPVSHEKVHSEATTANGGNSGFFSRFKRGNSAKDVSESAPAKETA